MIYGVIYCSRWVLTLNEDTFYILAIRKEILVVEVYFNETRELGSMVSLFHNVGRGRYGNRGGVDACQLVCEKGL